MEKRRVRSKIEVLLILLFSGWWIINYNGRDSYNNHFKNLFGKGYWSFRKFNTCGRVIYGEVEDGLFVSFLYSYQERFLKKIKKS